MPARLLSLSLLLSMFGALAACAAPPSANNAGATPPAPSEPAPPERVMSTPLPPRVVPTPATVDYGCRQDADCAVKNVGNCCGAMPACVNKDSPTSPDAVQAECAASGRMSVCGFVDVSACQCVSGRCEPDNAKAPLIQ